MYFIGHTPRVTPSEPSEIVFISLVAKTVCSYAGNSVETLCQRQNWK